MRATRSQSNNTRRRRDTEDRTMPTNHIPSGPLFILLSNHITNLALLVKIDSIQAGHHDHRRSAGRNAAGWMEPATASMHICGRGQRLAIEWWRAQRLKASRSQELVAISLLLAV